MTGARTHRASLWLLLAAALFMRAFVPQGYMAERSDSGTIAVTLCGSDGVHLIPLKQAGNSEQEQQRVEPPCAFAGLGTAALPPPGLPELPLPAAVETAYPADGIDVGYFVAPRLRPPVRGPPLPA